MKKGKEPAFPTTSDRKDCQGISTRLYLAGMAMQGILAGDSTTLTCTTQNDVLEPHRSYKYDYEKIAKNALRLADELIKQEEETRQ